MLPLMSTRIARLSGDSRSDRNERIGRSSPLSRISKSFDVNPETTRPRPSRTDACIVTTSTALRKTCRLGEASCALAKEAAMPTNAAAQATGFRIDLIVPTQIVLGRRLLYHLPRLRRMTRTCNFPSALEGLSPYRREQMSAVYTRPLVVRWSSDERGVPPVSLRKWAPPRGLRDSDSCLCCLIWREVLGARSVWAKP